MAETVKIGKSGSDLVITIPVSICEHMGLEEGVEVDIEPFTCGGDIGARIRPKKT